MLIFIALNLTTAISDYYLGKGRNYKAKADAYKSQQLFKEWKNYLNIAEGKYLTAIKYNKYNTSAFYRLGVLYLDRDNYGKAIEIYENLLDYSPYYPEAHKNLGIAYSEMGETETGIDHLKRSLERIEDADTYFALGRLYERIAEFDSMMYYQEKFLPKAAQELSRIKNLEGYAGYKKIEMQTLSSQFNDIFDRLEENYSLYNSWERAIEPYSRIVEIVPDEALFRFHLGVAYRHTQDCGRAIEELKKSLKLAHGKRYYRLIIMQTFDNLADCYFILDEPELAKDALQKLITINPQSPLAEKARKRLAEME
jgi:tetratricopeptide (TPR) repeat protein